MGIKAPQNMVYDQDLHFLPVIQHGFDAYM